jgi:hypothetical protein
LSVTRIAHECNLGLGATPCALSVSERKSSVVYEVLKFCCGGAVQCRERERERERVAVS